jgi:hypothetical protein
VYLRPHEAHNSGLTEIEIVILKAGDWHCADDTGVYDRRSGRFTWYTHCYGQVTQKPVL